MTADGVSRAMRRHRLSHICLLILSAPFAFAGFHTHYFYWTVTNDETSDFPFYTMTRRLDDVTLFWFDSDNEVIERRVPWFKSPHATLLDTSINFYSQQRFRQNLLYNISYDLNDTESYHVLQGLQGCTLYDNGTVQAVLSYRHDGKPFMSLNVETATWTAETPEAERYAEDGNSDTLRSRQNWLNICIAHIPDLLSLGNSTFSRKELSVIKVTWIPLDNGGVRLYCRAYGHYPKDIYIMWYKNGEQISEEILERLTLPYPDLTYLTSLSLNVTSTADGVYTCKVSHSSMTANYTQDLRISGDFVNLSNTSSNPLIGAVIAICLAVILIAVLIAFGSVVFMRR
ncbi:major histocompatibility complex class I-related gene protein-like [Dendropsophus ebraccatus]|uniref:major histocompatibility complex class I-related gene protein-like n=1 Tax=Dendropsophus ebraccatus TaxID=150705 RepID=UPI003831053A